MSTVITCPSGLSGEIRGLKGKEGKLLADRAAARSGSTFEKILAGCWLATIDPGIYDLPDNGAVDWSRVLVAELSLAKTAMVIGVLTTVPTASLLATGGVFTALTVTTTRAGLEVSGGTSLSCTV